MNRANPHCRSARPVLLLALALLPLAGLWACDSETDARETPSDQGDPGSTGSPGDSGTTVAGAPDERVVELIEAWKPADPTATSDVHDRRLHAIRDLMETLREGPTDLGESALRTWRENRDLSLETRNALLDVAAHTAPEHARETLVELVLVYAPEHDLLTRTLASDLLSKTSPARSVEILRPILEEERPRSTYPPTEQLVRHFARAARLAGSPADALLAAVATGLYREPDARYAALSELGDESSDLARQALERVLVESSSDGLIRRKAAQALARSQDKATLCAILFRVAERESDPGFLEFLADMTRKQGCE